MGPPPKGSIPAESARSLRIPRLQRSFGSKIPQIPGPSGPSGTLGSGLPDPLRDPPGPLRDPPGTPPGPLQDPPGTLQGPSRDPSRTPPGPLQDPPGPQIQGPRGPSEPRSGLLGALRTPDLAIRRPLDLSDHPLEHSRITRLADRQPHALDSQAGRLRRSVRSQPHLSAGPSPMPCSSAAPSAVRRGQPCTRRRPVAVYPVWCTNAYG